jgi:hypothetical protein
MKNFLYPSNAQNGSDCGRRNFLSQSLLASSTLLLAAESHVSAQSNQDDAAIPNTVSLADSIALYADLIENVRRFVLQKDAEAIYVSKAEATTWLFQRSTDAEWLRSLLGAGKTLSNRDKSDLIAFLSEVDSGGKELTKGLIRMRYEALEEIKNLDTDFDKIRAEMALASNAIKKGDPGKAKQSVASAIQQLSKYSSIVPYDRYSGALANLPPMSEQEQKKFMREIDIKRRQERYQSVSVPATSLRELLQTVLGLLNATPASRPSNQHHSRGAAGNYYASSLVAPALQNNITAVLRSRLNPSSWLQRAIGYAVAFPILLRVSDKNNRIKLLNDALRVVPPGLRNPLLEQLATDLANLN